MSPPRLRVAFDNSLASLNVTGTGVYASQLIRHLEAVPELDLTVISGISAGTGISWLGRKLHSVLRFLWVHSVLPLQLRKGRFDVVHAPAFVTPFGGSCPTVVTIHDLSFLYHPHHFSPAWRTYVTSLMPVVLRSSAAVICVSENTRRDLLRSYDVPESKVHVVYNGLDHSRFRADIQVDRDWIQSVGIKDGYILHVGVFSERKNIPGLLRAIASLRDACRFDGFQLVLAGKEAPGVVGARAIEDSIEELRLQDTVVKLGHVPDDKLPGLYAGAALLTMPSLYEGFGFPVIEAMACGTPVVASNSSSLPEITGDAALLVPPAEEPALADAIYKLLHDRALRAELRARGLTQAQKFSWELTARRTVDVYRAAAVRQRFSSRQT